MKNYLFLLGTLCLFACSQPQTTSVVDEVDATIGGVGQILQPTRATVQVPNQLVRWTPLRADLLDDQVSGYPLTLTSHRQVSVFSFLPLSGNNPAELWNRRQTYDQEVNHPYDYQAQLDDCRIAFAPSKKSGIVQVTFQGESDNYFRLRTLSQQGEYLQPEPKILTGETDFSGMKAYTYMVLDTEAEAPLYEGDDHRHLLVKVGKGPQTVQMRYGISYISIEQAKANLEKEIPDFRFAEVQQAARAAWEHQLGKIQVKGGTEAQRRVFYTSLYRCFERMVDINEYGQYYSAFDHQVHQSDQPFYVDNWLWDTYIALEPLITLLDPAMEVDKINSYIDMYRQSGVMPSFAIVSGDWPAMTGNYAASWMADAWFKGLKFDLPTAYEGLKKNSLDATLIPWRNGPRTAIDDFYNEKGYFPALHPGEQETIAEVDTNWERRQAVSITTAFSTSDWNIAQLARELNKQEDTDLFLKRAAFYQNVYRPEKAMMWPKDKDGQWIEDIDPRYADRMYYTENNAYTFIWDVKHDLQGLIGLMGGREQAERNLDELYRIQLDMPKYRFWCTLPDATGMVGQFAMGNEPSFHIPYLYNYVGAPWKTQKRIHMLIDTFYTDNVFGLPGDEDGGGMSAFVVFSMMGFFPVTPGIPAYAIGSPFFEETTISLPNGKTFTVKAPGQSKANKYIQEAKLNGKPLNRSWITHEDILQGGTLELIMGDTPNKQWATQPNEAPPSDIQFINAK